MEQHASKDKSKEDAPAIWDHARDMGVTGRLLNDQERSQKIRRVVFFLFGIQNIRIVPQSSCVALPLSLILSLSPSPTYCPCPLATHPPLFFQLLLLVIIQSPSRLFYCHLDHSYSSFPFPLSQLWRAKCFKTIRM